MLLHLSPKEITNMATIIGTHHFVSKRAAEKYYASQGHENSRFVVRTAIDVGCIVIGAPDVPAGAKLVIDTVEGRYKIEEG